MTELQLLLKNLAADRQSYEATLLCGKAVDFAEYRQLVGTIRGLVRAENIVKDLVQRLEKSDE